MKEPAQTSDAPMLRVPVHTFPFLSGPMGQRYLDVRDVGNWLTKVAEMNDEILNAPRLVRMMRDQILGLGQ